MGRSLAGRLPGLAVAIAVASVLVVALTLMAFTMPVGDDLERGAVGVARAPAYAVERYLDWTGRALAFGMEALVMSAVDILRFYPLVILAQALLLGTAFYVAVGLVLGNEVPRRARVAATLVLGAVWWAGAPALGDSLYWFVGGFENLMGYVLAVFVVAGAARASRGGLGTTTAFVGIAATAGGFFVPLLHELAGLQLILVLGGLIGASWTAGSRTRRVALMALGGVSAGLLFNILAPGNALRARVDGAQYGYNLGLALERTSAYLVGTATTWILDPKVMAASLMLLMHPSLARTNRRWTCNPRWRWLAPLGLLMMVTLAFAAPIYATGWSRLPYRTITGIYTVFVLGWFFCVGLWQLPRTGWSAAEQSRESVVCNVAMLALAFTLVFTGNLRTAADDLRGPAGAWQRAVAQRYAMLRDAAMAGHDRADIPPLPLPPQLFFQRDAAANPDFWYNRALARYFGLEQVRVVSTVGRNSTETAKPHGREPSWSGPTVRTTGFPAP